MNGEKALTEVVRSLKGAPGVIFLALVLHGGPQTVRMLCTRTGYSDKAVRPGLLHLQRMGLAYRDRELRAWYLVPGSLLLAHLSSVMEDDRGSGTAVWEHAPSPAARDAADLSTELSTGPERADATEENSACGAQFDAVPSPVEPPRPDAPSSGRENKAGTVEDSSPFRRGSAGQGHEKSSSRAAILTTTPTTADQQQDKNTVAVSKYAHGAERKYGRNRLGEGDLKAWLTRGGIAPGSPKMREILAQKPDLQTVMAHVLERQASVRENEAGAPTYGVGLLIRKLLDGDPPPPMRCETCLELPDSRGWCRCDYDALIKS
jgi:hypothetical protein